MPILYRYGIIRAVEQPLVSTIPVWAWYDNIESSTYPVLIPSNVEKKVQGFAVVPDAQNSADVFPREISTVAT